MIAYQTCSDGELIYLLGRHDQRAFDEFFSRHWLRLYQSAFLLLQDPDASKDVVQEVFVWIWENRQSLAITHVNAYLKAAVRHRVANYIHSGKIRETVFHDVALLHQEPATPTGEELVEAKEL